MTTWTPTLLRNGLFYLDAGCMFGMIPRVVWSRWFPESGPGAIDELNRMPLQQNSLLLESSDGKLAIIEVGIGDKMTPKEQSLYTQELHKGGSARSVHHSLDEIKCDPKDISAVILTHLHFDHAGALTRLGPNEDPANPVLTFPNAEIFVAQQELDDALANKSTMHKTYLPSHLTPEVLERIRPIDGEHDALPGIHCLPTPGHTWGQHAIRFEDSSGQTTCFVGDVMPTKRHCRPTCNLAYDVEPYTSMLQRIKLLERAHKEHWTLVLDHEPDHASCTCEPDADRAGQYRLVDAEL